MYAHTTTPVGQPLNDGSGSDKLSGASQAQRPFVSAGWWSWRRARPAVKRRLLCTTHNLVHTCRVVRACDLRSSGVVE